MVVSALRCVPVRSLGVFWPAAIFHAVCSAAWPRAARNNQQSNVYFNILQYLLPAIASGEFLPRFCEFPAQESCCRQWPRRKSTTSRPRSRNRRTWFDAFHFKLFARTPAQTSAPQKLSKAESGAAADLDKMASVADVREVESAHLTTVALCRTRAADATCAGAVRVQGEAG